jgi:hypothetical protein
MLAGKDWKDFQSCFKVQLTSAYYNDDIFLKLWEGSHLVSRWRCLPCRLREFDVKLFRRKRFLLRNINSATLKLFIKKNMKHKIVIEIPPYYIDTLGDMAHGLLWYNVPLFSSKSMNYVNPAAAPASGNYCRINSLQPWKSTRLSFCNFRHQWLSDKVSFSRPNPILHCPLAAFFLPLSASSILATGQLLGAKIVDTIFIAQFYMFILFLPESSMGLIMWTLVQ